MTKLKVLFTAIVVALCMTLPVAAGEIDVSISPVSQSVDLSAGTTTVEIFADIPVEFGIVQWGLDLDLVGTSVSIDSVAVNTLFDEIFVPDGDGLGGLVPPGSVPLWGDDILLATVTFNLEELGVTNLVLSDDNAFEGQGPDLTEGFALEPEGEFANVEYFGGSIDVIPEPAALALLALGGLVFIRRR